MNKHVLGLVLINMIGTGTVLAETTSVSCPQDITMNQLSTLNTSGALTVNNERFVAEDRENINKVTPKGYHPSSFTALAHLRSHETRDNKIICNYGYKSTFGNIGSKLSETLQGTPKEELNRAYDYTFTITHQLPEVHHESVPSQTMEHVVTTPVQEEGVHQPVLTPPEPQTVTAPSESVIPHTEVGTITQTYVITRNDIEKDLTLKDALETLGLVNNPKITKFIVETRYKFLLDDAERKSKTATPLDLTKINEAIHYVRSYFESHQNQKHTG